MHVIQNNMKNHILRIMTLLAVIFGLGAESAKSQDIFTIEVSLDSSIYFSELNLPVGSYIQLEGQSAFLTYRTSSSTSGGPLNNVSEPGTVIQYEEGFPEPAITDYQTFGYFGIVGSYDEENNLLNRSFVATFLPGSYDSTLTTTFFTNFDFEYSEDDGVLADAFGTFDSPEFLNLLDNFASYTGVLGDIALPTVPEAGQTMDLVAFIGGVDGYEARKIGEVAVSVIPEPSTLALLGVFGAVLATRRKRRVSLDA